MSHSLAHAWKRISPREKEALSPSPPRGENADEISALVRRVQGGDREAFRGLVDHFQRPLYRAVMRRTHHAEDASDIVQQALIKAFEKLPSLREPEAFSGWLYRIAFNLTGNQQRKQRRSPQRLDDTPELSVDPRTEQQLIARERLKQVSSALQDLTPKQREVFILRIEQDLSCREIAAAIGSSEGAVRVHFHNAVQRLKEALD